MSFSPRKQHHGNYCDYARCRCGCCLCCCRWRCRHGCDVIIKFIHFYDSYCCCCCMFFFWRVAVQLLYRYDLQSLMGFCVSGARKIASRASEASTLAMRYGRPARGCMLCWFCSLCQHMGPIFLGFPLFFYVCLLIHESMN